MLKRQLSIRIKTRRCKTHLRTTLKLSPCILWRGRLWFCSPVPARCWHSCTQGNGQCCSGDVVQSCTSMVNYRHQCAKCFLIAPDECCQGLALNFHLWKCLKGWFVPDSGHGERIQCHFFMPNLFKCFCLKAKLMIFTSTKASTTTQDMHFCICRCIRMASENNISCPCIPLDKHYGKVFHAFYAYEKAQRLSFLLHFPVAVKLIHVVSYP